MRSNKFSRTYFLTLILLTFVAAEGRPAFAQSKPSECGNGTLVVVPREPARLPAASTGLRLPPTPVEREIQGTRRRDNPLYRGSIPSREPSPGSFIGVPPGGIDPPLARASAAVPDKLSRRDGLFVVNINTSGEEPYSLRNASGDVIYTGSSVEAVLRTLNTEKEGQRGSTVPLEVNGPLIARDAFVTSLSIEQQQRDPGITITRGPLLGTALVTDTETIKLSSLTGDGKGLMAVARTVRLRLSGYRERRKTDRIIRRSVKSLGRTHPATKRLRIRKEAGRTRLVSIPPALRAAGLWTAA